MSKLIVKDLAGPASSSNKIFIASGSELDIANSSGTINLAVDAGDIASGTLPYGRFASGTVVNSEIFTNNTRTAMSSAAEYDYWSVSYTKKLTNSILVVHARANWGGGSAAGVCGTYIKIDGTFYYSAQYTYAGADYPQPITGIAEDTSSTGGAKTIALGWKTANGNSTRPTDFFNPNSSDDARSPQTVSVIHVLEVVP
jgi:hypothetical protein|tara:strand:+ start:336 stop:932 length:597 start_codon:yes stop_codon:yes gene_type:complete